jgi:hypothetical protein
MMFGREILVHKAEQEEGKAISRAGFGEAYRSRSRMQLTSAAIASVHISKADGDSRGSVLRALGSRTSQAYVRLRGEPHPASLIAYIRCATSNCRW